MNEALSLDRFDEEFSARCSPEDWRLLRDFRDHPHYLDGVVMYDDIVPELFANNIILNKVVTEISRIQTIVYTLHLYDTFDPNDPATGLTLSRLQKLCIKHDLASSGGVIAFIGLMTVAGYLNRQRSTIDRRVVHFVPSAKFIDLVENWTRRVLQSIDAIEPEQRLADCLTAHPRFGWDVREGGAQRLLGGWQPLGPFPEVTHFLSCQGGWMLLCHYVAEMLRHGGRKEIVPVSIDLAAFGKSFGVSRTHLRRMLERAHDKGLLDAAPRNGSHVLLSPRLLAACLSAQAGELATLRRSAHAARQALGLTKADVAEVLAIAAAPVA